MKVRKDGRLHGRDCADMSRTRFIGIAVAGEIVEVEKEKASRLETIDVYTK